MGAIVVMAVLAVLIVAGAVLQVWLQKRARLKRTEMAERGESSPSRTWTSRGVYIALGILCVIVAIYLLKSP